MPAWSRPSQCLHANVAFTRQLMQQLRPHRLALPHQPPHGALPRSAAGALPARMPAYLAPALPASHGTSGLSPAIFCSSASTCRCSRYMRRPAAQAPVHQHRVGNSPTGWPAGQAVGKAHARAAQASRAQTDAGLLEPRVSLSQKRTPGRPATYHPQCPAAQPSAARLWLLPCGHSRPPPTHPIGLPCEHAPSATQTVGLSGSKPAASRASTQEGLLRSAGTAAQEPQRRGNRVLSMLRAGGVGRPKGQGGAGGWRQRRGREAGLTGNREGGGTRRHA